jgi:hypothetical protein
VKDSVRSMLSSRAFVNTPFLPLPSAAFSFSAVAYTMMLSGGF